MDCDREARGSQGALSPAPPFHLSSPGAWEEVRWQEEEVSLPGFFFSPKLAEGRELAVVTPGPLSPRFSQALSFLGGRNWKEGVRNLGLMSQAIRPSNSLLGYRETALSHPLPPGTCPQIHLILRFLIPSAPESCVETPGHLVQRQGDGSLDLRINLEKRRRREREEQDSIWPSTAKH